jgi:hypothetical protein
MSVKRSRVKESFQFILEGNPSVYSKEFAMIYSQWMELKGEGQLASQSIQALQEHINLNLSHCEYSHV